MIVTQERLKEILLYDPVTGIFRWRQSVGKNATGSIAGTLRSDGYIRLQVDGERRYASHWAWLYMTGNLPGDEVDHEDRNRANNAWSNLRPATKSQNCANRPKRVRESGLPRGVTRRGAKYVSQIRVRGETRYLGIFQTAREAHERYRSEAELEFGEFSVLSSSSRRTAA